MMVSGSLLDTLQIHQSILSKSHKKFLLQETMTISSRKLIFKESNMAAILYLVNRNDSLLSNDLIPSIRLDSDGYYWFLHRYFEAANLDRQSGELIDLYGGQTIDGYQLHRLRFELVQALEDVELKQTQWKVLVGWNSDRACLEGEIWEVIEQAVAAQMIAALLTLIDGVDGEFQLVVSGD